MRFEIETTDHFEVQLGNACLSLIVLLEREMDTIFQDIIENLLEECSLQSRRASAANRIVLLCRSLPDELHRYAHLRALDEAVEHLNHDAIDF